MESEILPPVLAASKGEELVKSLIAKMKAQANEPAAMRTKRSPARTRSQPEAAPAEKKKSKKKKPAKAGKKKPAKKKTVKKKAKKPTKKTPTKKKKPAKKRQAKKPSGKSRKKKK